MCSRCIELMGQDMLPKEPRRSGDYYHAEQVGSILPTRKTEDQLAVMRRRNNPDRQPVGHFTGRCSYCGSTDLWTDNLAYGCNSCGVLLGGN